ncbi:flagellar biosynthesis anti-sigma factor FlgM [Campylobacter gastrosuis]|uniref:Flagellar biosynthesis anti-sigma factor FlgM n=1 Tax=Campylobacter gastrosuis TaxID=2974576 RepID=A0ABT7HNT6_9BACT|nr:flagellar biosynthesis anti-sigma factor FlgM [Campylobacter gastrosuis]MDL0088367.1 flagellar biosynthesis anti-sigma factor FlgM [Campylobacter gastrosuis]
MISGLKPSYGVSQNLLNKTAAPKREQTSEITQKQDSKLASISKAISEGTYELDMKKTAKAIVDTLV